MQTLQCIGYLINFKGDLDRKFACSISLGHACKWPLKRGLGQII